MPRERSLDELLLRARGGDKDAFGALFQRLSPGVAGYLRAHRCPDVEDVTSEVFLAAFRGISRFEGDAAALRPWLFSLAHRRRVDAIRRAVRRPQVVDAGPDDDPRSEPSAEDSALAHTGGALALLHRLTEDQREVLALRVVADLSLEDTAVALGRSVGAVKSLQHRALEALRQLVDEDAAMGRTGDSGHGAYPPVAAGR
jgi:RNA polymerase sigma factor (sigma-70 family)